MTTPGDAAGNYVIVRTFTATDDCGNRLFGLRRNHHCRKTPPLLSSPSSLQTYTVECSDEMPMDDATASDNCRRSLSRCPAKPPLAMLPATT